MQKRIQYDDNEKYHKVGDHCHYTGKYRGAAHDICNLRYKIPKEIPLVFHSDSTYDYRFKIKQNLMVSLNTQEKIQKNVLLFQFLLKKSLTMVNQVNTK